MVKKISKTSSKGKKIEKAKSAPTKEVGKGKSKAISPKGGQSRVLPREPEPPPNHAGKLPRRTCIQMTSLSSE